jgi:hypothetical protein
MTDAIEKDFVRDVSEAAYPSPGSLWLKREGVNFHTARLCAFGRNLPGCRAAIIRRGTGVRPFRHPDKPRPTATARAGSGRHYREGKATDASNPSCFSESLSVGQ